MLCPHCNLPVHRAPEDLYLHIAQLPLTYRENQIARAILKDYPEYTSKRRIAKKVWTEEEMAAFKRELYRVLGPHISVIRRKLKKAGNKWTIVRKEYRGYRFELVMEKELKSTETKVEAGKIRIDYQTP